MLRAKARRVIKMQKKIAGGNTVESLVQRLLYQRYGGQSIACQELIEAAKFQY